MKKNQEKINIEEFLSPEKVYIKHNNISEVLVSLNDQVLKNEELIKDVAYSPISGVVTSINDKEIVIANDYKEHVSKRNTSKKNIYDISLDDIVKLVNKYCPFTIKSNYKYLILSLIDQDAFEVTSKTLIDKYIMRVLETIDCLSSILKIDHTFVVVSNKDELIVECVNNNIGTYPNIIVKRVNDTYAIGYKEVLIPKIINRNIDDINCLFLNIMDVISINNAIKNKRPTTERFLTVMNYNTKETKVINCKIGTKLEEIRNYMEIQDEDIIVNGLIGGIVKSCEDIVTYNTRSIFFANELKEDAKRCINCGLCKKLCPVSLNPKYIRTHKNASISKCIGCGTCTYICPSKINFKPYLGDHNE